MKILFVQPDMINEELLGVMVLSSCLKQEGHQTKAAYYNHPDFLDIVRGYAPDIMAYSVTTGMHYAVIQKNLELKEKGFKFFSVFGGPHATFNPKMIYDYEGIDAVCVGEGEKAFCELANRLSSNKDVSTINNLWIRINGNVIENPLCDLVSDLDELPFYDYELFQSLDKTLKDSSKRNIMLSRGCPNNCTYCFNRQYKKMYAHKGTIVRTMSVKRGIEQLKNLKNSVPHLKFIEFHDDIFPYYQEDDFEEFYELYKKEIGIKFYCYLPLQVRDEQFLSKLKDMGCYSVGIGVEAGDESVRKNVLKRPKYSNAELIKTSLNCRKLGLKVLTTNLVGLPIENSLENDIKTMNLNIKMKPTIALSYMLYPYPGTEIAATAIDGGFLPEAYDILFNNKADSLLSFSKESKLDIEKNALLFGIIANFPFLMFFYKILLGLPKAVLVFLYFIHRGYKGRVSMKSYFNPKEIYNDLFSLVKYLKFISFEKKQAELMDHAKDS